LPIDIDETKGSGQLSGHARRSPDWGSYKENLLYDNPSPDADHVSHRMGGRGKTFPQTTRFEDRKNIGPGM
jgi:hypothetical protein